MPYLKKSKKKRFTSPRHLKQIRLFHYPNSRANALKKTSQLMIQHLRDSRKLQSKRSKLSQPQRKPMRAQCKKRKLKMKRRLKQMSNSITYQMTMLAMVQKNS
jgi:hypothetical protein